MAEWLSAETGSDAGHGKPNNRMEVKTMKGFFCSDLGGMPFAELIVDGIKTAETRRKDMLARLVGERVAIIRTRRGKLPVVVGWVKIIDKAFCPGYYWPTFRKDTCVPCGNPADIEIDDKGKWLYWLSEPERCRPYPLPAHAIRHGRSWAEWDETKSV